MAKAALSHTTLYDYDREIHLGPQLVRLRPAPHCRTSILSYSLKIEPSAHFLNWQQDAYSNFQARLVFAQPTNHFHLQVDLIADIVPFDPFAFFIESSAEIFPFAYCPMDREGLAPYLQFDHRVNALGEKFHKRLFSIPRSPISTIDFLVTLNGEIHREIGYVRRFEPGVQTPEYTLAAGSGSCRDSSWLLVQLLRHCGLAARFVSGYLIELDDNESELHAWCEVYVPGAGWIGLDSTSGLLAAEGHIPLACTPEPNAAAPVEGCLDRCETKLRHSLVVGRL